MTKAVASSAGWAGGAGRRPHWREGRPFVGPPAATMHRLFAQVDLSDLVLVVLLGICSEQHPDPRDDARGIQPDLCLLRIEAQQHQLRIVLSALVPCGDKSVP